MCQKLNTSLHIQAVGSGSVYRCVLTSVRTIVDHVKTSLLISLYKVMPDCILMVYKKCVTITIAQVGFIGHCSAIYIPSLRTFANSILRVYCSDIKLHHACDSSVHRSMVCPKM